MVLFECGVESYLRASALFVAPGWWVSANDAQLAEQHRRQTAAHAPVEVMASCIDAADRRSQA